MKTWLYFLTILLSNSYDGSLETVAGRSGSPAAIAIFVMDVAGIL